MESSSKRPYSLSPPSSVPALDVYIPSHPLFPLPPTQPEFGLGQTESLVRDLARGVEVQVSVGEEGGGTKKRRIKSAPRTSRACCASLLPPLG